MKLYFLLMDKKMMINLYGVIKHLLVVGTITYNCVFFPSGQLWFNIIFLLFVCYMNTHPIVKLAHVNYWVVLSFFLGLIKTYFAFSLILVWVNFSFYMYMYFMKPIDAEKYIDRVSFLLRYLIYTVAYFYLFLFEYEEVFINALLFYSWVVYDIIEDMYLNKRNIFWVVLGFLFFLTFLFVLSRIIYLIFNAF